MKGHGEYTPEEQFKHNILKKVIAKEIKPGIAAKQLGVSTRQIRRLKKRVKEEGIKAVVHGLKGKESNHKFADSVKEKTLSLIREKYHDFKPTFASEKLQEIHNLPIKPETARLWMTEAGLWVTRRQKKTGEYRNWRPRKEYFGEMQQFDGSYHFWFEKRFLDKKGDPIEVCLLAAIDDATGRITRARFMKNEGVAAVFTFWKGYVQNVGKPLTIYLDKFSTYKINHKAAVDNKELMTQFQRAMQDLGTQLIFAHSPQAKGRIEKLFLTLQDRLVKEMRLAGINTPEEGNKFLEEVFLPKFNNKFSVIAAKDGNVHRSLSEIDKHNLNRIFSVQSTRVVNNDFTIQFKNHWFQLTEVQTTTVRAKERVTVEEWLDGTIHVSLREKHLSYIVLPGRPKKANKNPTLLTTHPLNWKPPKDHPWRKGFKPRS